MFLYLYHYHMVVVQQSWQSLATHMRCAGLILCMRIDLTENMAFQESSRAGARARGSVPFACLGDIAGGLAPRLSQERHNLSALPRGRQSKHP